MLYTLFTLAATGYGLYWVADTHPDLKEKALEWIDFRSTSALEMRYEASQLMEIHQKKLLKEKGSRFLDPELKFYPYLLMEAKYSDGKGRTKESYMLWDMIDGEMILDAKTWEKTHGFADCILQKAGALEFAIIHTLSKKGGSCDASVLHAELPLDPPVIDRILQLCITKNLIIKTEPNKYRIHLETPHLTNIPMTKLSDSLTTRVHKHVERAQKQFTASQIKRIAMMAFGETFAPRNITEIYIPVHRLIVQKPDGSIQTSHFNAHTGKELPFSQFYQ